MMVDSSVSDLVSVLSAISNEISFKIIKAYEHDRNGLNLTDTSKLIEEKTTTVKDHLTKLMDSNLIYVQDKKYYLSYLGLLILEQVKNIELLNETRKIFGHVSSDMIPPRFLIQLIPYLKGIKVFSNQWAFMNLGNKLIDIMKNNIGENKTVLKLIGWNSIPISLEIIRNSFNNLLTEKMDMKQFFMDINLSLITDLSFLSNIEDNDQIKEMMLIPEFKERILICQDIEKFNFMLIRYNKYLTFFLNTSQETDLGPYFIIRSKPKGDHHAIKIFEEIFEYFSKKSTPLVDILEESI